MGKFFKETKKEITENILDYLVLTTASVFFLVLLATSHGEKMKSFFILCAFVLFYVLWGTYHHYREKTLRLSTMIEYILIGSIALFFLALTFLI